MLLTTLNKYPILETREYRTRYGRRDTVSTKIFFLDIETSFKIAAVWGRWKQNIAMSQLIQDSYVLCWSGAWLGEDEIVSDSLHYHKAAYTADPTNDLHILQSLHRHLDAADIVVAHNGKRFDVPTVNARFIQHGMQPPSTYRVYDTLHAARRHFKFTSNRLDDLGTILQVGNKIKTDFELWSDVVLRQDKTAFDQMVEYCEQDVELLESVYMKLRPWDDRHPSTVVAGDLDTIRCNVCGSEHIHKNGSYSTNTQRYQKYKCGECGHNMRSRYAEKLSKHEKHNLLRSN